MDSPYTPRPSLTTTKNLELNKPKGWRRLIKWIVALVVVACGVVGFMLWRQQTTEAAQPNYESAEVTKGNIEITVSVTGTIGSVDAVDVGAEVSGRVDEVLVQFNEKVTKGQVLARINTEQLDARIKEARAQSASAHAALLSAQATAAEAKANANRMKSLSERGLLSQKDYETAHASAQRAEAQVASAKAQMLAASASLESATSSREKAIIRSPIDGIVLSRAIEPGQTVASSFQAPVLFTVAKDLTTMVLKANVDEADVGKVKQGQRARFSVDAYKDRIFESTVLSVKNTPTSSKDVVTYEAELSVNNSELLLRPGMTATATIISTERRDVVVVPNAALRFAPLEVIASAQALQGAPPGIAFGGPPPHHQSSNVEPSAAPSAGIMKITKQVWVLKGGNPSPIDIVIGETDGNFTEVLEGDLPVGTKVLVDVVTGVVQ